jgi:hypothetical protein
MDHIIRVTERRDGLCYAVTDDGIEVPVIDIMHPDFTEVIGTEDLARAVAQAVADVREREMAGSEAQEAEMRRMLAGSFLVPRIAAAQGKVLGGMSTYYMKLGPGNLGPWAGAADRALAGSLPCVSVRMRLRHVARFLAEGIAARCADLPGAELHVLDIAGGPCMDAINALLVVQRESPGLVSGRRIVVHALDTDPVGPLFGGRALAALCADGGPLRDLDVTIRHVPWDWSSSSLGDAVRGLPDPGARVLACSSEGGLFEYATDADVARVLVELRRLAPDAVLVGTVTRTDGAGRIFNTAGGAALRMRAWEDYIALARRAGWRVLRFEDSPLSRDVVLTADGAG